MEKLFEKPKVMIFEAEWEEKDRTKLTIPFVTEVHGFFIEKSEEGFETFYLDEMYKVITPTMFEKPCGKITPILKYEKGEEIDCREFLSICRRFQNSVSDMDDCEICCMDRNDFITYNHLTELGLVIEKFSDDESNVSIYIDEEKSDTTDSYMTKLEVEFNLRSVKNDYIVMKETYRNWKRIKDEREIKKVSDRINKYFSDARKMFSDRDVLLVLEKENINVYSTLSNKSIEYIKNEIMRL